MTNNNYFRFMFITIGMAICGFTLILLCRRPMFDGMQISDFSYVPWLIVEFLIAFFLEFIMLRRNKNPWLLPCVFFLSNFGILVVGRLENSLINPQIRWIIIGMVVFFIVFRLDFMIKKLLNYKYVWGILCLTLGVISILFGSDNNGVLNSISIAGVRLQPLEFAKIFLVIFLASYLGKYEQTIDENYEFSQLKSLLLILIIYSFSVALFVVTKDLGNAIIFFAVTQILIYVKSGNKFYFFVPMAIFILSMIISYFIFSDIKIIFDNWLNPWTNSNDTTKQIIESLFAFGAGGIWGSGFTMGHPEFISNSQTNYIFSAIAEEFGLIGIVSVIIIYVLFFYQSVIIAYNLKKEREIFLVYGIGILFFLQTLMLICSAVNLLPVLNFNLPFISYGGSAILSNFVLLGILISFSRKEKIR